MRRALVALLFVAACNPADESCRVVESAAVPNAHGPRRRGAYARTPMPAPTLEQRGLGERWSSEPLDTLEFGGVTYAPLVYASPLFAPHPEWGPVIYTATSNGWAYAIDAGCDAGTILWRTRVAHAVPLERLDGGVPMGVLSTPVLDVDRDRMYLAAHDAEAGWRVHALSLTDGAQLPDWPVTIDDATLAPLNTNGPARFQRADEMSQRGALSLAPDGDRLYVPFGTYWGSGTGWIVGVDTSSPRVSAAFSSAPSLDPESSGGIWGSTGPVVDDDGAVWATTGNSPATVGAPAGVWGNSLLQLDADLQLQRAYSPFDHCVLDRGNMDLGASQPLLLSGLPESSTPNLVAFGGKQGVVYLVDADAVPPAGERRRACSADPRSDHSLLPPEGRPLSVFGPHSYEYGEIDHAKMRTSLAQWADGGTRYLFASGTSKEAADSTESVAPSIAKLAIRLDNAGRAFLELAASNPVVVMQNPGPPAVTGSGDEAIVWVLDRNAPRTAPLLATQTPHPRLYAFAASDLRLLASMETRGPAGKYAAPIVVADTIIVSTDRIEAFALGSQTATSRADP